MARAADPTLSPDLRALGIRALSSYRGPTTVTFLVDRTLGRKRFFRRRALAGKTPEMLAALSGLATHWRDDPAATVVLAVAEASNDREIADAVARRGGAS
jgi:hypothetical protein